MLVRCSGGAPALLGDVGGVLVADRFARDRRRGWIDLATGRRVVLRAMPPLPAERHRAWLDRTRALGALWHPHLLVPIDFGDVGRAWRFEAWPVSECGPRDLGRRAAGAVRSAVAFLQAHGLTAGRVDGRRVRSQEGRPVLVPDASTGHPIGAARQGHETAADGWRAFLQRWPDPPGLKVVGVRLQERAALRWAIDVLDHAGPGELRRLRLRAGRGAGTATFVRMLAREARLRGYVPVDVRVAARWWSDLAPAIDSRHVLVIDVAESPHALERVLLSPALRRGRSAVVLSIAAGAERPEPLRGGTTRELNLDPVPAQQLAELVFVYPPGAVAQAAILDAARRAEGQPGRFVALLQGTWPTAWTAHASASWVLHETGVAYVADTRGTPGMAPPSGAPGLTKLPPDLRQASARAERAVALARGGRHAAAERSWRAAIGAFARRGRDEYAHESVLALAGLLADRGRTREVLARLRPLEQSPSVNVRLRASVLISSVLTDEAQLAEAETTARAAKLVAGGHLASDLDLETSLALARCLFWQNRLDEAATALPSGPIDAVPGATRVWARRARIELARSRLAEAGRAAAAAVATSTASENPRVRAGACAAMAAVLAAVGDEAGFRHHAHEGLAAANRAHAPLLVLRLQLVRAEGCLRLGLTNEHRALARTLARWAHRALPALLAGRVQHVLAQMGSSKARAACDQFVRATGAHALSLQVPEDRAMDGLQELSDVLRICHESPDEATALGRACAVLRERLRAIAVSVIAGGEDRRALTGAGSAWAAPSAVAARAISAGLAIPPTLTAAGVEAAAPFRYAGQTIGALVGRWPVDTAADAHHQMAVLTAAAAACAPSVRTALDRLATPRPMAAGALPALLGASPAIDAVRLATARAARVPFSVLIEGESGSGKELVARAIHAQSDRRTRRFCAINCAALSDDLLDAELFGHARGAFTGAVTERPGLFEDADGGTLLLDEVSELSPRAQAKLLRTIQDGEIRRVGENLPRRVDVRLVAVSNRSLEHEIASGRFRADLRYRLDVIRIVVPPLRERAEDVPLLAGHFWEQAVRRTGSRATLDPDMLAALARYDWPGNVRELQNVMTALAVHAGPRGRVGPRALPDHVARAAEAGVPTTLEEARQSFERRFVRAALARAGGHRGRAARALGLSRQGLTKLLRRLDIDPALLRPEEPTRAAS